MPLKLDLLHIIITYCSMYKQHFSEANILNYFICAATSFKLIIFMID